MIRATTAGARRPRRALALAALGLFALGGGPRAEAGVIFGFSDNALGGGFRWDAAPRNIGGLGERSLNGGLRYSLQGGSYQAYRDLFTWNVLPTVAQFQQAVEQAFAAWTSVDPATGLGTAVSFAADFATGVVGTTAGGGVNPAGAEIDLFGAINANNWDPGNTGTQGETFFNAIGSAVTLTSGTAGYAGSGAISGADITLNSNPGAVYNLDLFRRLLTHEIGHAIGLGDVEGDINPGAFIDDNFNAANAVATLTNSWALLVNPLNPAASALQRYAIGAAVTTPGVDILMESRGLGISAANPVTNLVPLANDDYGTRQFLYPSLAVPEPGSLALLGLGAFGIAAARRRRARRAA